MMASNGLEHFHTVYLANSMTFRDNILKRQ